jgi:hypothetical protein
VQKPCESDLSFQRDRLRVNQPGGHGARHRYTEIALNTSPLSFFLVTDVTCHLP